MQNSAQNIYQLQAQLPVWSKLTKINWELIGKDCKSKIEPSSPPCNNVGLAKNNGANDANSSPISMRSVPKSMLKNSDASIARTLLSAYEYLMG